MASEHEGHPHVLIIEPFYGGSHRQLVDLLMRKVPSCVKYTLPAKKWHWNARTSALHFAQIVPRSDHYKVLFSSSVLNLAELIALRPDLAPLKKVLYFHENQLVYPVRKQQDRDFQYGYNQIISCLVANLVLFNSYYNIESFLSSMNSFISLIPVPDYKLKNLNEQIRPKCEVLYFPLELPQLDGLLPGSPSPGSPSGVGYHHSEAEKVSPRKSPVKCSVVHQNAFDLSKLDPCEVESPGCGELLTSSEAPRQPCSTISSSSSSSSSNNTTSNKRSTNSNASCSNGSCSSSEVDIHLSPEIVAQTAEIQQANRPLHIVWAHRWEHDKNPDGFFGTLMKLTEMDVDFHLSVLGESFADKPAIFSEAELKLQSHIANWGYQSSKQEYYSILLAADVAVSTAVHEFFGVSMLEAVHCGCYPLCPNRLVYPEIFPNDYLYNTQQQLLKRLREFCRHPHLVRDHRIQVNTKQYSWEENEEKFISALQP